MKILDILHRDCIVPELNSQNKREVLEELTGALLKSKGNLNKEALVEVLLERERLGSTGIGDGIAIPHGKIPDLDELVLSFGRSDRGIEFDSMDGRPTHLFFLLIAPENSAGIHLRALAKISRLLKSAHFRQRLMEAGTKEEIFRVIQEEDKEF
ncbi:MAG: PTS sugar transporter subunit IIA [Deltaproteobacteria bacterium]|nr:MAG: PTS sugar transporter subunit IIA [Deltaproteobacteria bacterium]